MYVKGILYGRFWVFGGHLRDLFFLVQKRFFCTIPAKKHAAEGNEHPSIPFQTCALRLMLSIQNKIYQLLKLALSEGGHDY